MNRPRVTPVVAAALVLVAGPLFTHFAAAAPSASLADIRTTPLRDDFDRPNESPLSGGGTWAKADTSSNLLQLVDNQVTLPGQTSITSLYQWTPQVFDGDVEVWATFKGGLDDGAAADLGLVTDVGGTNQMDGYVLRAVNTFSFAGWQIRKRTDWGGVQVLAQGGFAGGGVATGHTVLFRRQGNVLEGWRSRDGGATWTLEVSASDATYATGFRLGLGLSVAVATSPAWDDFGGGATEAPPPSGPPPGQSIGTCSGAGSLGLSGSRCLSDPVNTRTGAFVSQVEDLATPGTGVPFSWTRSYTSTAATVGPLGPGWTVTYAASLDVQPSGDVLARGEEGQEVSFVRQADGSFVGAPGARAALSSVAGGYELRRVDQVVYRFTSQGRLLSVEDRNGQGVALSYDAQGRLRSVTDADGKQATVSYNASGLVDEVRAEDGRGVLYGYTSGRLASVTDVRGERWTHTYDASGRLATVVDPLGHTQVANVYGGDGRVQRQTDAVGKTAEFAWDAGSEIATVTDANGKAWKHDYDEGVLAKEIDPLSNVIELGHDDDLNIDSVTSPTNEQTQMTYDAAGNLLSATTPPSLGSVRKTFVHNARNDPERVVDARGTVTDYAYTPDGNLERVAQDGVQVAAYAYDPAGRVLAFTDGNGNTWTYDYLPTSGYLGSVTDPLGNRTTYTYDAPGRVATRVDPKGNVAGCGCASQFTWTYTHDAAAHQLTETDPLGHTRTNVYDAAGRLIRVTDPNGHSTSYTYDAADRVVAVVAPDPDGGGPLSSPVTTSTYDDVGNTRAETGARGNTTSFAYDAANRLVLEIGPDPDGGGPLAAPVTSYGYDANGNLASRVEPRGNTEGVDPDDFRTTFDYDAAGRLLRTTDPLGHVGANTYDPVGNLASTRDANGHATNFTYDAAGRVQTVTAPDGGVTTYGYDDSGNLVTRRDGNGHVTTFAYDAAGNLVSERGPDPDDAGPQVAPLTSHTYDPNGNRVTLTDPNGNATPAQGDGRTTFAYDRGNRLISIDYSDETPDVGFGYDDAGNRVTMTDGEGVETRVYDGLDRLVTVRRGQTAVAYGYDPEGNVIRRTYPGDVASDYVYDALNRVISVASAGQATRYGYDAASKLTQTALPSGNGYVETRAYDRAGRLTEVSSQRGGTVLSRFVATLDPVGNPLEIARTGSLSQTQAYAYDVSDRLIGVCYQAGTCPGASDPFIRWTYDVVGNRLSEERPSGTTTYSYDARDRLLSAAQTSYGYDENGNELSAGSRTFAYDLANRLESTTLGSTTTTYAYDGDGVRLESSTGSQASRTTGFVWDVNGDHPQIAVERDGNGKPLRRYVYGVRRVSQTAGNSTSYLLYDGLGSVVNAASSSGATQWTFSYEPFGSLRTEAKANGYQPAILMRFAGEYLDPTGLYHLRARQYDQRDGRFLRPDPAGQSPSDRAISAYAYAANRPTVMIDPAGELFSSAGDALDSASYAASIVDWTAPAYRCQAGRCGGPPRVPEPVPCGVRPGHPLARKGVFLGGPYAGTHTRGNWQSDRAVDIGVPVGTKVCALFEGKIGPRIGPLDSADPRLAGQRLTVVGTSDEAYYAHLSKIVVRKDQPVRRDQVLGYSGTAGVPHLHIALKRGDPRRLCMGKSIGARC